MNFCSQCGNSVSFRIPADDDRPRYICDTCNYIHYQNPRLVICAVPCFEDKVLLCRRAIEPRYGLWTLPGGFMENAESTVTTAQRETLEEACARVSVGPLYSLYNLPHINQVHLFYLATLDSPEFGVGRESLETALMTCNEIPWDSMAFAAVRDTLQHYFLDRELDRFPVRVADIVINDDNEHVIQPHRQSPQ